MRQALCIDGDVPFDARDLLARVVAFVPGAIGVLHALRIDDQEAAAWTAPLSGTGRAKLIFLKRAPARFCLYRPVRSIWQSTNAPYAI